MENHLATNSVTRIAQLDSEELENVIKRGIFHTKKVRKPLIYETKKYFVSLIN
jgi:hypothetical protein